MPCHLAKIAPGTHQQYDNHQAEAEQEDPLGGAAADFSQYIHALFSKKHVRLRSRGRNSRQFER